MEALLLIIGRGESSNSLIGVLVFILIPVLPFLDEEEEEGSSIMTWTSFSSIDVSCGSN